MIGVAVPVHNEEALLGDCLGALRVASEHAALAREPVVILAVMDSCTDGSASIAASFGIETLCVNERNVGASRAAGARWLLDKGARWLSCTDADTVVSPSWIADQLALASDAVCGTVDVRDWTGHEGLPGLEVAFRHQYSDLDGHSHIHGANLGVCATAYLKAGGFSPIRSSEDVALVQALQKIGARIAWSAKPRVATSARLEARAPRGFGHALSVMARALCVPLPATPP